MTIKSLFFCLSLIVFVEGCDSKTNMNLPDKSDVVATDTSMPIDGLYNLTCDEKEGMTSLFEEVKAVDAFLKMTVRFDRGRAFAVENFSLKPGTVMIKNITKIDDFTYEGVRLIPTVDSYYECKTTIYMNGGGLIEKVESPKHRNILERPVLTNFKYLLVSNNK